MKSRGRLFVGILCALLLYLFFCAPQVTADELRLKDGTKIVGRIVGYENDSFKVEMSYGFALVRRDKVASITMTEDAKGAANNRRPAPAPRPAEPPAQASSPAPAAPTPPPATVPAAPLPPPEPVIREEIEGNLYTNHVYKFQMYKPPSWHLIEGARRSVPNAVMAMGTSDESTMLIVGREAVRGSLETQAATIERRLRDLYENYRALEEERTIVAGLPAVMRRFRGTIQDKDWSGRVICVARGNDLFTFFGMTTAESDLIQIQENVIDRAIASLEFVP